MNLNLARQMSCTSKFIMNNILHSRNIIHNKSMAAFAKPKSTVDEEDVARHSKLMNVWWDKNGLMKGLHGYNAIRVPFVRDGLVNETDREKTLTPLANKKILDVGCGGGILSEGLARIGANVTGVDASTDLIELAREHSNVDPIIAHNKPTYYNTTIEEHSVQFPDYYDAVVASEVLEHVADKELFLKSCINCLKPNGKIFITTPNKSRVTQVVGIYLAEYVLHALPKGTHEYEKFTTPKEVTFMLERNNCHVEIVRGTVCNPLTNVWHWSNSHIFCFALQASKLEPSRQHHN